jgi:hypothetical protein
MNSMTKLALTAVGVLLIAVVGYNLLPRTGGVGSAPTPTPTSTPTLAPSLLPASPTPAPTLSPGPLSAGTYTVTQNTWVPYRFTLPAGWGLGEAGFFTKGGVLSGSNANGVGISTWNISHIYTDSCHWSGKLLATGTQSALAAGLAAQTGHTTSAPTAATISGVATTRIAFSVPSSFNVGSCDKGGSGGTAILRLWPDPGPDEGGGWMIFPGQTTTVYPIEVAGKLMVVLTIQNVGSSAADVAELQSVLATLQFQP